MPRTPGRVALLATGFAGVPFALTFLLLGAIAAGYNSSRDTISALEFTSKSLFQRINFLLFGLMLMAFALALRRELGRGRGAFFIPALQALAGIGVVGDAIFIDEPLHLLCDLLAFNSSLLVLLAFTWRFRAEPQWRGWTTFSFSTALLMMALLTAFGVSNHNGGPAGAFEKLASIARTAWSVALVSKLLSGKQFHSMGS